MTVLRTVYGVLEVKKPIQYGVVGYLYADYGYPLEGVLPCTSSTVQQMGIWTGALGTMVPVSNSTRVLLLRTVEAEYDAANMAFFLTFQVRLMATLMTDDTQ